MISDLPLRIRFQFSIEEAEEFEDPHWIWCGALGDGDYGVVNWKRHGGREAHLVHRAVLPQRSNPSWLDD